MNIVKTLLYLRPGEEWNLSGNSYENITWLSSTPKPTLQEVQNGWDQIKTKIAWEPVREKRNLLLFQSDWTQAPDVSVDKQAWVSYRQELRDITKNFSKPEDVVWPLKPGQ